ncbi:MAG: beta-sandwich domain-containing protein [Candidatus Kryptoniota bacterium]
MVFITPAAYSGNIKGRVHIIGAPTDQNAVIYIERVNHKFTPPDTPVVMDQKNLMFTPEVLPVLAGTTVKFVNSDPVLHDVFSPSTCGGQFDLGLFPSGESRVHVFNHAGCAAIILCDVHPEMQAWVVVLQNPYYAVTNSDGWYVIRNVPAGTYTLKTWYNYYGVQSVKVTVPESGEVEVNFQLKQ